MTASSAVQLDLFLDSRAVVLANEIASALLARDLPRALSGLSALRAAEPDYPSLHALERLGRFLAAWSRPIAQVQAVATARELLQAEAAPAASIALSGEAPLFLQHLYGELANAASDVPYDPAYPDAYCAALYLRGSDPERSERAALAVPGWRDNPDALAWLTLARYRLQGLSAARPSLFALAWRAPDRIEAIIGELGDTVLDRDWRSLQSASDWTSIPEVQLPAWLPAWCVLEHPALSSEVESAGAALGAPADAARLLTRILPLEKRGSSRALVDLRKRLRDLNREFFDLYMARRTVQHR